MRLLFESNSKKLISAIDLELQFHIQVSIWNSYNQKETGATFSDWNNLISAKWLLTVVSLPLGIAAFNKKLFPVEDSEIMVPMMESGRSTKKRKTPVALTTKEEKEKRKFEVIGAVEYPDGSVMPIFRWGGIAHRGVDLEETRDQSRKDSQVHGWFLGVLRRKLNQLPTRKNYENRFLQRRLRTKTGR